MELAQLAEETVRSGVLPLVLKYQPLFDSFYKKPFAYRSIVQLYGVEIGVLLPDTYMVAANRSLRAFRLMLWQLDRVARMIQSPVSDALSFEFITVQFPSFAIARVHVREEVEAILTADQFEAPHKICFEFPPETLWEDHDKTITVLRDLHELGFKTMVSGYGSEFCPPMRLAGLHFDYLLLDPGLVAGFGDETTRATAHAMLTFSHSTQAAMIAPYLDSNTMIETMHRAGCVAYASIPATTETLLTFEEVLKKEAERNGGEVAS